MAVYTPTEPRPPAPRQFALWTLGFRSFYLFAGIFAALSVPLWAARFAGWLGEWVYASESAWHAHEMIFGYAFAVIVGFLFTAVRNWTARPTPAGTALMAIAALWASARMLAFTPWTGLAGAADVAFAAAAAVGIGIPLVAAGNRRNYFFIVLIALFGALNLGFHLAQASLIDLRPSYLMQLALDLILFIMSVMGGRVIPMFTANALSDPKVKRLRAVELVVPPLRIAPRGSVPLDTFGFTQGGSRPAIFPIECALDGATLYVAHAAGLVRAVQRERQRGGHLGAAARLQRLHPVDRAADVAGIDGHGAWVEGLRR